MDSARAYDGGLKARWAVGSRLGITEVASPLEFMLTDMYLEESKVQRDRYK